MLSALGLGPAVRIVHSDQNSVLKSRWWLTGFLRGYCIRKFYSEGGWKIGYWIESTCSPVTVEHREQVEAIGEITGLRGFIYNYIVYYKLTRRNSGIEDKPVIDYFAEVHLAPVGLSTKSELVAELVRTWAQYRSASPGFAQFSSSSEVARVPAA